MKMIGVLSAVLLLSSFSLPLAAQPSFSQLDNVFLDAESKGQFGGSVLIVDNGATLYDKGFGEADKSRHEHNKPTSQFLIASLSKPITAVAVLRLVEQGKLRLDDRLDTIFPELKGAALAGVTISQLLSHTSGMEEVLAKHLTRPLTPGDLKDATFSGTPDRFAYSNSGYIVLKLAIEKVSGQGYAQMIDALVFKPSGMAHSGVLRDSSPPAQLSLAYQTVASETPMARVVPLELFDGPGSIFSTTGDLALFDKALNDGKLLSPKMLQLMASGPTPSGAWGYGWAKVEWDGKAALAHQGDFNGYHAVLVRQPETRKLIVILSNLDKTSVSSLQKSVLGILEQAP